MTMESGTERTRDSSGVTAEGANEALGPLPLRIGVEHCARVNFAMQQNRTPLVGAISLTNVGSEAMEELRAGASLANGEAEAWSGVVSRIGPGETYTLEPRGLALRAASIASRTERERTELVVWAESGGRRAELREAVELLPFDHWGGLGPCPEMLAAFVTPNHPALGPVLAGARDVLRGRGERDAIDGYQSGSRTRAALLAEACFVSLARGDLGYIAPPASFERAGQRVRLADSVLRDRMGTCLDLSLLLAGLWEQAGLNAVIVLLEDHALPAVWTHDEHLPEAVIDEVQRVRKEIELGELVPVESTVLTHAERSFGSAVEAARRKLAGADTAHAVDVRTARRLGIRPLPLRVEAGTASISPDAVEALDADAPAASLSAVELAERAEAMRSETGERAADRVDRWKRKLLDLSLRNRLLNFRETNRSLALDAPDLAALEDRLADGGTFDILARPARRGDQQGGSSQDSSEDKAAHGWDPPVAGATTEEEFRRGELEAGRVYATSPEAETAKKLLELYRAAKSSIEETGANVLFLVLGMLHWYEAPGAEAVRRAPLVLLPVSLVRRSAGGGYRYRVELTSEPLRPNITLLEKLKTDFGIDVRGLEALPEDERGLDVPLILRRFREAVRDVPRWEVVETAHLGLLSFNKFLMWHDLQQHGGRLREQRLVRHLIDRDGAFDEGPFAEAGSLDADLAPGELLCTRDADSSQLVAVRSAGAGRTFVLEGPPGTGKSQTIANIVADAVGRGRRVLFVAEKMAALSVVRRRLEQDGLGPFCLELHSAKASKKEVLRQLGDALDAARAAEPASWADTCGDLARTRERLNAYVRELHAPMASGESIYQMIGRLAKLGDGQRVDLAIGDYAAVGSERLRDWRARIGSLVGAAEAVDPPGAHPLRGIGRAEWSFALPEEARGAIGDARGAVEDLGAAVEECASALLGRGSHEVTAALSRAEVGSLHAASALLESCPAPEHALLAAADISALARELTAWIERGRERDRRRAALLARYRPELLSANLLPMLDAVKQALAKPGVVRWLFAGGARKQVRPYCLAAAPPLDGMKNDLEEALSINAETLELGRPGSAPAIAVGAQWKSGEADWDERARVLGWCVAFRAAADGLTSGAARPLRESLLDAATRRAAPGTDSALTAACRTLAREWNGWNATWKIVHDLLAADETVSWGAEREAGWLGRVRDALARWMGGIGRLNDWCRWRREREQAVGAGLGPLVELYERGAAARTELGDAFERSFGERWLVRAADTSEVIRGFNAREHGAQIERFRRLDQELIRLTRLTVAARVAERLPGRGSVAAASSEVGILERERQKRARHLPTRRLIELLPNLLPRLKPCFLMSPLSVAQYLDPHLAPFDLVVFDEASQIPVWDAIGTIARGAEVIVVGDSKQLPPTNFFNTLETGDDEETATPEDDELESILQECNASGVPSLRLKWHYRSRHESLITFSNHHYYDGQLQTFPSPLERSEKLGVALRLVEGAVYDRGGTRTNRAEAEAVVAEVLRMLAEPGASGSIGIVTFNAQQQGLIEDMLDEARRARPEVERYFTEVEEPVFVKNLENVQGDERDAIIFSVGFGPDANGRVSMNFGPLNTDGGERRLNVAITRARSRLLVFSSIRAEAIDLSRTRAVGVRHFKRFLDYAERGPAAIAEASSSHREAMTPSELEEAVAAELRSRGWEVDARVGCAGYRIDMAVRDPEQPGRYLLGVECDGPMYRGASTARDRDRTRRSVLEGLGWRLARVWSTAWRLDRDGCVAEIEGEIGRARERRTESRDQRAESGGAKGSGAGDPSSRTEEGVGEGAAPEDRGTAEALAGKPPVTPSEALADEPPVAPEAPPVAPGERSSTAYRVAARPKGATAAADIFAERNTERAAAALVAIVEQEGPIVPELALRRLAEWFGVSRITDRYRERFGELLGRAGAAGSVVARGDSLWPAGADPEAYDAFRSSGEDDASQRDAEWIPLVERAAAVRHVLREQIALPREDLEREAARALGIQRATTRTREVMGEAIDTVIAGGFAAEREGKVALAE